MTEPSGKDVSEIDSSIPFNGAGVDNEQSSNDSRAAVEATYQPRIVPIPLRFLALSPLHKLTKITLSNFDRLRHSVITDETLRTIERPRHSASSAELIIRACHLLFALVESGGLLAGAPEKEIANLKINVKEAKFGLLYVERKTAVNQSDELPGAALRIPLHALGRLHLAAFVRFRLTKQKAKYGDPLLPELNLLRDDLNAAGERLGWLKTLPDKSNITWRGIFRHWLNYHLQLHCDWTEKASWRNVSQIAAWHILDRDRYPFLLAARRRLFQSVPLPDERFASIFAADLPTFTKHPHSPLPVGRESKTAITDYVGDEHLPGINLSENEDFEREISTIPRTRLDGDNADTNFGFVNQILSSFLNTNEKKKTLIENLKKQANAARLRGDGEADLRNLLLWTVVNLKTREVSTAHTYAVRVLRALFSIPQTLFSEWTTEDVAEYLENYTTNASVKNVRTALEQFDNFLKSTNSAQQNRINWRSRSLQSPVYYAARDVISNPEYENVRLAVGNVDIKVLDERQKLQSLALLMLLRRAGLRVGEAASLTPANFKGFRKWCLIITKSKTQAGLRKLPFYLLLDENEIAELRAFVERRISESGFDGNLFIDDAGVPLTAQALGRKVEKLLRNAGIEETAHGLRHAFASSLFASFWLNLTQHRRTGNQSSYILRALKDYARPTVEGRAVPEAVFMQQLLGHADLRVTFERYIHLVELAGADAVHLSERSENYEGEKLNLQHIAKLLGMDAKLLKIGRGESKSGELSLIEAADVSCSRLPHS